jgi:hypothetical protein
MSMITFRQIEASPRPFSSKALEAIDLCRSSENNFGLTALFCTAPALRRSEKAPPADWAGVFVAEARTLRDIDILLRPNDADRAFAELVAGG